MNAPLLQVYTINVDNGNHMLQNDGKVAQIILQSFPHAAIKYLDFSMTKASPGSIHAILHAIPENRAVHIWLIKKPYNTRNPA